MLVSRVRCLFAIFSVSASVSCAATEQDAKLAVTSADFTPKDAVLTTTPASPAPTASLSVAEASEAAALVARCGFAPNPEAPTYELTQTKAPTFEGVIGPIQLSVAEGVNFGRLAEFMAGFIAHGAGAELVVKDGSTEGALLLLLEGDYAQAPLTGTKSCRPMEDTWQLHVRDRSVRLQARDSPSTWRDISGLGARAAELQANGAPRFITLNATANTPVSLAVWALATVRCAVELPSDELPPMLQLGELCDE